MFKLRAAGLPILCLVVIAGCGGGGSVTPPPPPPAAPTVTSTTPSSAATGVAVNTTVSAVFSQAMNSSTLTTTSFTLKDSSGNAVAGAVSYSASSDTATFTPSANLAYSTQYTATITTTAANTSGTTLAANDSWSFTTAAALVPPMVTSMTPGSAASGVSVSTTVSATFSQAMTASSLTTSTFTLTGAGAVGAVAGTVTYNAGTSTAVFTPAANLVYSTVYTATITTGATDSAGTALAANDSWSFTTAAAPLPPPSVTTTTPANGTADVATNTTITATFSQAMTASTISAMTFTVTPAVGSAVAGSVTYSSTSLTATFTPAANLAYNTVYTAMITTGVTNSSGIPLASSYSWSFTTEAAPVPTVTTTVPANGATNVSANNALTAAFSEAMQASSISATTFLLSVTNGAVVSGTVSYSGASSTATFTPSAALSYSTSYTATITTGAMSTGGAALAANYVWTFTTAAIPNQVTVDFSAANQTIRGFGGSTAWLGKMPLAVATALFSPTNGLGLSILRVRIDPEGSPSSANPYETGEWDYEAANGKEAVAANPNVIVFASPWTPPANWKLNGSTVTVDGNSYNETFNTNCGEGAGYCGGYLDPNHYADYANYLEDFVTFFNTTNGFNLYAISMQNEPEENVTYESSVWTPQQMDTWVAGNASTITSDKYSTKLMMPESDVFNPVDAATALSDPNAEGQISIVAGHIYQALSGGSIAPYPAFPAGDTPKELWMTEFGPLSTATPSFSDALTTYAESIHNSLVTGQYNAYVWWGAFGDSTGNCATAAGTCGLVDNSGNVSVTGEMMGQYSKFVQPGYSRYDATANPTSGVFVSAYGGTEGVTQHYVIVAINANSSVASLPITIKNATVTSLTPYQSTASAGLAQQTAVMVTGGQFTYTLPAQSITTFVQ